ncbi:MAG: hypothetical protein HY814_05080, partial [Candidatus Riflebacteria bacterium]|nr:hypothetical protein [Candidatus Riflebacteria bacterium]
AIRLRHYRPEDLVTRAVARDGRNLTREEWTRFFAPEPYSKTCTGYLLSVPAAQIVTLPAAGP